MPLFLHPALLFLLPLALIPIVLHLLTLHRLKTVELSTFRFLFDSYIQQRRRMQFLEALLAMLRTLFLLLLGLMIAGPVFSAHAGLFKAGSSGRDVVLLVDCSASMNARSGGAAAFDRAKASARVIAGHLGAEDRLTLIQVGAQPKEVFSNFSSDAKGVEEAIEGLQTTPSRGNIFAALMHLFGPDASKHKNPIVYLFTDCQSSGWREVRNQGLEGLIPDKTPVVVVNVGATDDLSNLAVLGDSPGRSRAVVGLPILLQARVVNSSKTETVQATISVFVEDKEVTRTPLALKPGETAVRRVAYTPREAGTLRGRFEIAGPAPDRFPDDDRFLFTVAVSPRVKAVLVNGRPPAEPIKDVDEAQYLKVALTTGVRAADLGATDKKPAAPDGSDDYLRPFEVQEVPESGLNAETLRGARLVVLANCGTLNAGQFELLRGFVSDGGGLLIFPGDRVVPAVYNDQFFPVPGPQGERLTSARLGDPVGDPEKADAFERLGTVDFNHPALSLFDSPDPDAKPLASFRVYKWFPLALPDKKAWPLASFGRTGTAALAESRLGDGAVILAAFPAHTRWTSLPTRPDFAPLVLQLANHVARRPAVEVPSAVTADGAAEFAVNGSWGDVTATVKHANAQKVERIVEQKFERVGPRLLGSFTETADVGYYTLDVKSTRGEADKVASQAFAVNLSPDESEFVMLGEKQVTDLLPSASVTFVDASKDAAPVQSLVTDEKSEVGRPYWFALLIGILVSEFLMATWGGRRKKVEDESAGMERVHQARPGSQIGSMPGAAAG